MGRSLEYQGYIGKVEFDDEANVFHGEVINARDVITFEGTCVEEIRREFVESIEDYLEFCAARGEEPEKPFSGKIPFRTSPEIHRKIFIRARQEGTSMNEWLNRIVEKEFTHGS